MLMAVSPKDPDTGYDNPYHNFVDPSWTPNTSAWSQNSSQATSPMSSLRWSNCLLISKEEFILLKTFRWLRRTLLLRWKLTDCFKQHSEPRFNTFAGILKNSSLLVDCICIFIIHSWMQTLMNIQFWLSAVLLLRSICSVRVGALGPPLQPPGKEIWRLLNILFPAHLFSFLSLAPSQTI